MGEIAALTFDEIVLREDPGRRGRAKGEIMTLMAEGALRAGADPQRIHSIADELQAAEACMTMARPGDLVVLTPTEVEAMWRHVLAFRPNPRPHEIAPPERLAVAPAAEPRPLRAETRREDTRPHA